GPVTLDALGIVLPIDVDGQTRRGRHHLHRYAGEEVPGKDIRYVDVGPSRVDGVLLNSVAESGKEPSLTDRVRLNGKCAKDVLGSRKEIEIAHTQWHISHRSADRQQIVAHRAVRLARIRFRRDRPGVD